MSLNKIERRERIKMRIRKIVSGTAEQPRMTVYRSNKQIYVQFIDDLAGVTMAAASSLDKEVAGAVVVGDDLELRVYTGPADLTPGAYGIEEPTGALFTDYAAIDFIAVPGVAFDRNGYLYHGRVKQLAEAAREGGLKF